MRPVADEFEVSQEFASMATAGVIGNINASQSTVEYWVGRYGDYQPLGHAGMDFACPIGTPIRAMADGVVLYAGWSDDLPGDDSWGPTGYFRRWALYRYFPGIVTVIQHPGWIGVYAHQSDNNAVKVGQHVKEGQIIGKTGNTSSRGGTLDAHLHVEALIDLNYPSSNGLIYGRTNPRKYFGTTTKKEWWEMPDIPKDNLIQIADAVNNREFKAAVATETAAKVLAAPILSTDGKKWPLSAHIQGNTARVVGLSARMASIEEMVKQLAKSQGAVIDYAAVQAAAEAGAASALSSLSATVTIQQEVAK